MNVTITPSLPEGSVKAPPAKSMAHRLLIAAGLSDGISLVRGAALSEDVLATIDCLRALGAEVEILEETEDPPTENNIRVKGTDPEASDRGDHGSHRRAEKNIRVKGTDPSRAGAACLPCRESGSTLRFFAPLCMLSGAPMRLEGSRTLLGRPLSVYEEICRDQGIFFQKEGSAGTETGGALTVQGKLVPGEFVLDGNVSSQFVTGLLFALPLLEGDSVLSLRPPVESRSYIEMTLAALRRFGVEASWEGPTRIRIPGGQRYQAQDVRVEGDWSNAAFFLALGVPVTGLEEDTLQGDRICEACFRVLKQEIPQNDSADFSPSAVPAPDAARSPAGILSPDPAPASAACPDAERALSLADCPDLGPVLFAFAALHRGGVFTQTRRLRIKESDRGAAMQEELRKFGVRMDVFENRIVVGSGVHPPAEPLCGHNDHRIVMALAVLCTRVGGTICGAQAVRKSFPDFFDRLRSLGVRVEET